MLQSIPFPSLEGINDVSLKQKCKKNKNGTNINETQCGKNQVGCYVIQAT
jgi:hypothetical protein